MIIREYALPCSYAAKRQTAISTAAPGTHFSPSLMRAAVQSSTLTGITAFPPGSLVPPIVLLPLSDKLEIIRLHVQP